jgi:hypothetical protein
VLFAPAVVDNPPSQPRSIHPFQVQQHVPRLKVCVHTPSRPISHPPHTQYRILALLVVVGLCYPTATTNTQSQAPTTLPRPDTLSIPPPTPRQPYPTLFYIRSVLPIDEPGSPELSNSRRFCRFSPWKPRPPPPRLATRIAGIP